MGKKAGPCTVSNKNPEEKPSKRNKTHDISALLFLGLTGAREHEEVSFCFVPFQYICWFRFGFSHKLKSRRPDGRPHFFFSHLRPNVSRLRLPGAVRAQPCTWSAVNFNKHVTLMSSKLEPRRWSYDTGQRIPCFKVPNKLCWDADNLVRLSKQRKVELDW